MPCPLEQVRASCARVLSQLERHVKVHPEAAAALGRRFVSEEAAANGGEFPSLEATAAIWAADGMHLVRPDDEELTARCVLVVDALNFCFWPDGELEYEHVAGGVKRCAERDPSSVAPETLAKLTPQELRAMLAWPRSLPNEEERARLLRELGSALCDHFGGSAAALVRAAGKSASKLVSLLSAHLPAFRDAAIAPDGRQVFFYKRAQIAAGDIWGAFGGKGLGEFGDIHLITSYPDYRVPQSLLAEGVLEYSTELADKVKRGVEIAAGSEEELAIRAATVVAVEAIRDAAAEALGEGAPPVLATHVDWRLWQWGEARRESDELPPFHRTRTVFY